MALCRVATCDFVFTGLGCVIFASSFFFICAFHRIIDRRNSTNVFLVPEYAAIAWTRQSPARRTRARRPPPRLRSTRRSAVESGSTDSGGATSSMIFTSSSESRRRSKRFLASMRPVSRGKEGSGVIYFGLLPGVHACSERRQRRKWRRASERRQRRKRRGIVRRWRARS